MISVWMELKGNPKIFRYMDLWKFEKMLANQALWCSSGIKIKEINDKLEGYYPLPIIQRGEEYKQKIIDEHKDWNLCIVNEGMSLAKHQQGESKYIFINSWNVSDREQSLFWGSYINCEMGVVVVSDIISLQNSIILPECDMGGIFPIIYYDDNENVSGNMRFALNQFIFKRSNYASENEIRIILQKPKKGNICYGEKNEKGFDLPCDLHMLIKKIILDPSSRNKINKVIELTEKYGLKNIDICKSELDKNPPY